MELPCLFEGKLVGLHVEGCQTAGCAVRQRDPDQLFRSRIIFVQARMHHQLFESGCETLRAIGPDVKEQDLATNRTWVWLVTHASQIDPVIVMRKKHHGLSVCNPSKENPLLLWNKLTDLFRKRRPDVSLIRNDLLLHQESDEFVEPVMRHLVERCRIGGRIERRQAAVFVFLKTQG